ncbi:hypothetical protein [Amycolatopsis lurida]|uniref:hypothetical protein n=1 Tax=Amycolatopsis lurida TaxID=31959 RepID=UPI00115FB71C|nr:hypothetical protein [Amycolatopsis lurida]
MRPNVLALFSGVALAAATALAIQQSPNFTSQMTGLTILTSDAEDYRFVVVPLPYREHPRTIRAPVPETEIATSWSDSKQPGPQVASMPEMTTQPHVEQHAEPAPASSAPSEASKAPESSVERTPVQTSSTRRAGDR